MVQGDGLKMRKGSAYINSVDYTMQQAIIAGASSGIIQSIS
jgi:hypothetical protein